MAAEGMAQAYAQMWYDIARKLGDVPRLFEEVMKFAAENPVALIAVGLVVALLGFMIIRRILSGLERR